MSLYLRQLSLGPMENFVYLVGDTDVKKCVIVDPAWEIDTAVAAAEKDGFIVEGALLTHAHFDHCNAVDVLLAKRNMPIYVNPLELDYLDKGAPRGLFLDLPKESMKPVQGGDTLKLGTTEITFLHTPGHTPGSQCFLVNGNLMSGDTLFLGSCGRCDLPGSNPNDLFTSLNSVIGKLPAGTTLFPGHNYSSRGVQSTLGDEKKNNRFLNTHRLEDFLHLVGY